MAAAGDHGPWETPAADPVWQVHGEPLQRLSFMAVVPPVPPPEGVAPDPSFMADTFVRNLRNYARDHVEPELLEDRMDIWRWMDPDAVEMPKWFYLLARNPEAHAKFYGWYEVIKEDLECDEQARAQFVNLFLKNPADAPFGFNEANRILAHILKDKEKNPTGGGKGPGKAPRTDWSRFMERACKEALEALDDPASLKDLRNLAANQGYKGFGAEPVQPPGKGPGGSSSSSSSWQGPAEPGKGKGKHYQAGLR